MKPNEPPRARPHLEALLESEAAHRDSASNRPEAEIDRLSAKEVMQRLKDLGVDPEQRLRELLSKVMESVRAKRK